MNKTKLNIILDYHLAKMTFKDDINDQINIMKAQEYNDEDIINLKKYKKEVLKTLKNDYKNFKKKI